MTTLQFYNNELQTEFEKLFDTKCHDTKTQRTILNHIDINLNSIEGLINNINKDIEEDDLNDLRSSVELISNNVKKHLKSFFKQCGAQSKTKVNKNLYNIIKVKLNLIKKLLKDKYNLYERSVSNSVNNSLNSVPDENENSVVRLDLNLQSSRFGKQAKKALKTKKARRGAFKLNVAKQAEREAMQAFYAPIGAENARRRAKREEMEARYAPIGAENARRRAKREEMEARYAPIGAENARRRAKQEEMEARYAPIGAENARRRAKQEEMEARYAPIGAENSRRRAKRESNTENRSSQRSSSRKSNSVKSRKSRRRISTSSSRRRTSTSLPRRRTSTSSTRRSASTN